MVALRDGRGGNDSLPLSHISPFKLSCFFIVHDPHLLTYDLYLIFRAVFVNYFPMSQRAVSYIAPYGISLRYLATVRRLLPIPSASFANFGAIMPAVFSGTHPCLVHFAPGCQVCQSECQVCQLGGHGTLWHSLNHPGFDKPQHGTPHRAPAFSALVTPVPECDSKILEIYNLLLFE